MSARVGDIHQQKLDDDLTSRLSVVMMMKLDDEMTYNVDHHKYVTHHY